MEAERAADRDHDHGRSPAVGRGSSGVRICDRPCKKRPDETVFGTGDRPESGAAVNIRPVCGGAYPEREETGEREKDRYGEGRISHSSLPDNRRVLLFRMQRAGEKDVP